ncbi:PEP-CTERM protein-sorting domain-containing protein [Nitrosospira multiformis]|uniref:PEP-CTERM protein-sorting domain-containing protein n=1 Tax=Nitrosospira multiformis TaxID=1231 RepID=A0A1H8NWN7_9PROT|nr:PEP-CTERM sorting domain-containing protein [Nitrosospira multiformis]SEO34050.1 PEP-CTERM protein-sorting domain-containing protein [Nitrosospira multiformis]
MLDRAIRIYSMASIFAVGVATTSSAGMAALITVTAGGVPDGGAALYENFDNLAASGGVTGNGITVSFSGKGAGVASLPDLGGYYAAPIIMDSSATLFGNYQAEGPNETQYLTTGMGQVIMELEEYHQYFGLLWGSVDFHNSLSFYDDHTLLFSLTGLDIQSIVNDGSQDGAGSYYVNVIIDDYFNKVIASSSRYAFEFDNVALQPDLLAPPAEMAEIAEIPEPATLVLLGLGVLALIVTCRTRPEVNTKFGFG